MRNLNVNKDETTNKNQLMDENDLILIQTLKQEIVDLESDISLLQQDVIAYNEDISNLLQDIDKMRRIEEVQEHQYFHNQNYPSIPNTIRHSYFDSSVSHYFENYHDTSQAPISSTNVNIERSADHLDLQENILYENIVRMTGITSFPINKRTSNGESNGTINEQGRHVNVSEDDLLGIRFDVYSSLSKSFKTPHYIILRKVLNKNFTLDDHWSIYKHTLPIYIHLSNYESVLNDTKVSHQKSLDNFVEVVYKNLTKMQYKFDKFDSLLDLKTNPDTDGFTIANINKDLLCERINIVLRSSTEKSKSKKNKKQALEIELICSLDLIEVSKFSNFPNEFNSRLIVCQSILKNSKITNLIKNFKNVLKVLSNEADM